MRTILMIIFALNLLCSPAIAEENPYAGLSREQAIQRISTAMAKYMYGRILFYQQIEDLDRRTAVLYYIHDEILNQEEK